MQALGLIETRGLLAAIVCADVMLKAAQVELVERTLVGGGLVTIVVTGDVGAVKAAVEAGAAAVVQLDRMSLVSQHVIPRPDHEIEGIVVVTSKNSSQNQQVPACPKEDAGELSVCEPQAATYEVVPDKAEEIVAVEPDEAEMESTAETIVEVTAESTFETMVEADITEQMDSSNLHKDKLDDIIRQSGIEKGIELLSSLLVVKLRNLAREYSKFDISGRAVSKAGKELLLQTFQKYYQSNTQQNNLQEP